MNIIYPIRSSDYIQYSNIDFSREMERLRSQLKTQMGTADPLAKAEVVSTLEKVKEEAKKLFRRFPKFLEFHEEKFFSPMANTITIEIIAAHLDNADYYKTHADAVFKLFFTPAPKEEADAKVSSEIATAIRDIKAAFQSSDETVKEADVSRSAQSMIYELTESHKPVTDTLIQLAFGLPESEWRSYALGYIVDALVKEGRLDEALICIREAAEGRTLEKGLHNIATKLLEQGKWDEVKKKIGEDIRFGPYGYALAVKTKVKKLLEENKVQEAATLAMTVSDKEMQDRIMRDVIKKFIELGNLNDAERLLRNVTDSWATGLCYLAMVEHIVPVKKVWDLFSPGVNRSDPKTTVIPQERLLKAKEFALLAPNHKGSTFRDRALSHITNYLVAQQHYDEAIEVLKEISDNSLEKDVCLIPISRHFLNQGNVDKALELAQSLRVGYDRTQILKDVATEQIQAGRVKEAIALAKDDFTKEGRKDFMRWTLHRIASLDCFLDDLLEVPEIENIIEWTDNQISTFHIIKFLQHGVMIPFEQLQIYFARWEHLFDGVEVKYAVTIRDTVLSRINETHAFTIEQCLARSSLPIEIQRVISREYGVERVDPKVFNAQYKAFEESEKKAKAESEKRLQPKPIEKPKSDSSCSVS